MESGPSQQSALFERTLDKQEIHIILEGLFMQQVMELLGPCFKSRHRPSSVPDQQHSASQMVDLSSPSESIPEIVGANPESAVAPSHEVLDLDLVMSEISQRTDFACVRQKTPKIDIFLTRKIAVLTTILKNFHFNETCTKREIYYRNENLFDTQAQCDQIVEFYARLIQIPQHQLKITYNSKGLVHGRLRIYTDFRNFVSCDCNPDQGMLIPSIVYDGGDSVRVRNPQRSDGVPDGRHTVLVVEKATVFQRLIASKLVEQSQHSVTLVTGGGYPDLPTRRFVALCHAAQFRVVGIADCDPFGIEILMTYKWGSSQHAREKQALSAPSLEWLGLKPEHLGDTADSMTCGAPKNPLLPVDKRKLDSVILRLETAEDEDAMEWLAQAQLMKHLDCKCELEILHVVLLNAKRFIPDHTSAGYYWP